MNEKTKGHLAALFCAFVWGTTFISTKVLLKESGPVEILFCRFLLGYAALWLAAPRGFRPEKKSHELYFLGAGLTGVTIYYLFENIALTHTLAANVSIIVSVAPFFTAMLAALFLKDERLRLRFLAGFLVALFGVVLVTFNGKAVFQINPAGDLLALGAAFVWACYSVIVRKLGAFRYPVVLTTRRIFFYGLLFMLPLLKPLEFQVEVQTLLKPIFMGNLLFLGVCACALCFSAWNMAVDRLGAVVSSNYIYAIPVITVAASLLVLHEPVTLMGFAGMALTIIGLMISAS